MLEHRKHCYTQTATCWTVILELYRKRYYTLKIRKLFHKYEKFGRIEKKGGGGDYSGVTSLKQDGKITTELAQTSNSLNNNLSLL